MAFEVSVMLSLSSNFMVRQIFPTDLVHLGKSELWRYNIWAYLRARAAETYPWSSAPRERIQSSNLIRPIGSFIHGDDFNVLLEYADKGSLEDYFQKETPPSRGIDIIKFWEGLFLLVRTHSSFPVIKRNMEAVQINYMGLARSRAPYVFTSLLLEIQCMNQADNQQIKGLKAIHSVRLCVILE